MKTKSIFTALFFFFFGSLTLSHCGNGSEADRRGVGAECKTSEDCTEEGQQCLTNFKGGYCGVKGCAKNDNCPGGSACVTHDDSVNYCFLICTDKAQCNKNRTVENESNCSANITLVEESKETKACVPPSGN